MIYIVQAVLLTFIEALCCEIFFSTFCHTKYYTKQWKNKVLFFVLFAGFVGIAFVPIQEYILKAVLSIIHIGLVEYFQYRKSLMQTIFWAIMYYGLLICIDRVMLIVIDSVLGIWATEIMNDSIKVTIIALLCKMILFLVILFLNRILKLNESFNLITQKEWMKFLLFPIATILCMSVFAMEDKDKSKSLLIASFVLVLLNFLVFYIIRDIVIKEKNIQEMRLLQEKNRNQFNTYQYMEVVYNEQRKKTHEFKNYLDCIQGLLHTKKYSEAEKYVKNINKNWIDDLDYINTNNAIVNSILNQKFKLAKKRGIQIVLVINDLKNIAIEEEDIVTIVANLLENAIEACEKVKTVPKVIKMQFVNQNGIIKIIIRNPVAQMIKLENNAIFTTKENKQEHGIGLNNIRSVVDKYKGECIYSCNNGYFTYSIIINTYAEK